MTITRERLAHSAKGKIGGHGMSLTVSPLSVKMNGINLDLQV